MTRRQLGSDAIVATQHDPFWLTGYVSKFRRGRRRCFIFGALLFGFFALSAVMCRDGVGSSRKKVYQRGSTKRVPQLSDIHIPVGGPRLRPTLEDLLEMLIHDLGVDHADDALKVLEEQRVRWRVTQVQAIAKSMPNIVTDALRDEGYKVISPADSESTNQPPPWFHRY